jgi:hypothetical protein
MLQNHPLIPYFSVNICICTNIKVYKYLKIFGYFLAGYTEKIYLCKAIYNDND